MSRPSRRAHLALLAGIVAALAGVALLAVPGSPAQRTPTLGLDLQGGLEVVLQAVPPKGHKLTTADLDRSVSIMRSRVDKLGVSEPVITKQGSNQIVIELAGVHDPRKAAAIIGKTAQLELYDLETSLTGPSKGAGIGSIVAKTRLYDLLAPVQAKARKGTPAAYYLFVDKKLIAGPTASRPAIETIQRRHPTAALLAAPANTVVVICDRVSSQVCPGLPTAPVPGREYFYLFQHDLKTNPPVPQMSGSDLDLGGTRADIDPSTNQPVVLMKFTGKGNKLFREITRAEAIRGRALGQWQHFAIVLDNQIRSFPYIDYNQNPNGIDPTGGGAQITGLSSMNEAKDIALVLQTGALPVNFTTIERTDVSATLGKDSLRQAWQAAAAGLALVAVFLPVLYRFLGLVAVIGLGIYGAFLYAAILLFNVTLTLPGFAGMILTIGVAADANVVIFERIKEEARGGKSLRAAIANGYAKGFHTIVDANVVTAITALVLFAVTTAGVKGFALMLLIGTVISLITAVAATRAMLGLLAGLRWFENTRLIGAGAARRGSFLRVDFANRWRLWFAISGAFLLVSAVSLGVRGLNLGIDFKGGTQMTFVTPKPTSLDLVRAQAQKIGHAKDAVIQGRGASTSGNYTQFQVRTKHLTPAQQSAFEDDLASAVHARSFGVQSVSSSFGAQIARLAIIAILVSLFLIVIYITMRFRQVGGYKFAIPVIVGMLHDVLITIGIYSLSGREVTTSTVAAVLTVLGYSIYDNIIIFDRVRENVPLMRRAPFDEITDVSLWETIHRSLATTFITLLPIGALLFFGGATLKDFAFALLIGITSGAYSSIFIASPLLALWKRNDPEHASRLAAPPATAAPDVAGPAEADALANGTSKPTKQDAELDRQRRRQERRRTRGR